MAGACDRCMSTGGAHSRLCPTQPYMQELAMFKSIAAKFVYLLTNDEKDAADLLAGAIDREKS